MGSRSCVLAVRRLCDWCDSPAAVVYRDHTGWPDYACVDHAEIWHPETYALLPDWYVARMRETIKAQIQSEKSGGQES